MARLKLARSALVTLDQRAAPTPAKVAEPFYKSAEWVNLIVSIKHECGERCQDPICKKAGQRQRVVGDHIHELRDGGEPLSRTNVLLRCWSCHARKTNEQRTKRLAAPLKG